VLAFGFLGVFLGPTFLAVDYNLTCGCVTGSTPRAKRRKWRRARRAQIIGLRNRLIHGYDNVDFDILWQIVTQDLPPLIAELEKILSSGPQP
jgi:uncharacterized protein with HEPN domain